MADEKSMASQHSRLHVYIYLHPRIPFLPLFLSIRYVLSLSLILSLQVVFPLFSFASVLASLSSTFSFPPSSPSSLFVLLPECELSVCYSPLLFLFPAESFSHEFTKRRKLRSLAVQPKTSMKTQSSIE